jgi:hypothetical protein
VARALPSCIAMTKDIATGLCAACRGIAAAPHANHHLRELRLRKLEYAFYGTTDGTGSAVTHRHFVCEVCDTRWSAKANPDGSCCDWRRE